MVAMRRKISIWLTMLVLSAGVAATQSWQPVGPDGGSVRSLTFDPANPDRIFLGTSAGNLYLSADRGTTWSRFARLGNSGEMVLDHIVINPIDPRKMFVAAWNVQRPDSDGDLFRSKDAGKTWEIVPDLHGKSMRTLSMSQKDPKILVVGALDGIYRSRDGGDTWERISPENHAELRNIESLAVDPANPDVIYAGTWHLPWKTEDGGKSWHNIKKGVIDDSDVFSIVIDSTQPTNLFISACSGIYRSETAGEQFRKIQGIPYSARRTRMLKMDPADPRTVYAGTTEGLWKTTDSGATWKHVTGSNIVVNDVLINPRRPSRVLLATDRSGVLASNDGGLTFTASNRGFTHRQAAALLVDRTDSNVLYAGVLNDKEFGGMFMSSDAGQRWRQMSDGLDGRDIFVLRQAEDNTLVAGTDHGIFLLRPGTSRWIARSNLATNAETSATRKTSGKSASSPELNGRVSVLELTPEKWFAGTASGLFVSTDSGETWHKEALPGLTAPTSISMNGKMAAVAGKNTVVVSVNGGESWLPAPKPFDPDFVINGISVDGSGDIWLAARTGLFRSTDAGESWNRVTTLRVANVLSVQLDEQNHRILAVSGGSTNIFESTDNGHTWNTSSSGWQLHNLRLANGRMVGTTAFDGIVIEPPIAAENVAASGTR